MDISKELEEKYEEIKSYYPELRTKKMILEEMKDFIKLGFENMRELRKEEFQKELEENYFRDEDQMEAPNFDELLIDDIIIREKPRKDYQYTKEFFEEMVDTGKIHLILKKGNQVDKRFDLSSFVMEEPDAKQSLHNAMRRTKTEVDNDNTLLNTKKKEWEQKTFEDLVKEYLSLKKITQLKSNQYDSDKNELLNLMIKNEVYSIGEYSVKDPSTTYDFASLYGVSEMIENVEIATNGLDSVDLFNMKPTTLTPYDLFDTEVVKKKYRKDKIELLTEMLGNDFYYVKGKRIETDILSRFSISSSKVEELLDEGTLLASDLANAKFEEESQNTTFEITTKIEDEKRKDQLRQRFFDKKVEHSLMLEERAREQHETLNDLREKNELDFLEEK